MDKAFVFGNSAGGTSAIKFALKYPNRCHGLILVSSNVPSDVKLAPKQVMKIVFGSNFVYWSISRLAGKSMLSLTGMPKSAISNLSSKEKKQLLNEIIMGGFPVSMRTKGIINDMYLSNPDINNDYPFEQIKVPVFMACAKDDTFCSYSGAQFVSKKISDIMFVSYNSGGHLLRGHESDIKNKIADFIKSKE